MARLDPHSYNDDRQPSVTDLDWKARIDFERQVLEATVTLQFERAFTGTVDLDTRDLTIHAVTDAAGRPLGFQLHKADPILGARLSVQADESTDRIAIRYDTAPAASALQWLSPPQTRGGKHPFLFSQCQAIHARSVLPLQDTPRIRIRFRAELTVPRDLRGLMAAAFESRTETGDVAVERYTMPQPIPPYLFALAAGRLESRELGPRSRVWAEPEVVEKAAWEFEGVDAMLLAGEKLFGPYDWERFDILVMPPSFPYGGMENPRLTFLTPTLLAGDRSLVNVVAHELAHSWTGNLISNASADHFWLNEGFTVYAERRILEEVEGRDESELHAALGFRTLQQALDGMKSRPELTLLRGNLKGVDPDDAYSIVPYEKGYLFLRRLEEQAGRPAFDRFIRSYVATFRFQSITTEDFVRFLSQELPGAYEAVGGQAWLYETGLPASATPPRSPRLEAIQSLDGRVLPTRESTRDWSPTEWQLYLESVRRPVELIWCEELDARFHLTGSQNDEVLVAWLTLAAEAGYRPALDRVGEVLGRVGRMKFLKPLYAALCKREETQPLARQLFERHQAGYHPIARQVVGNLLQRPEAAVP